MTLQRWCAVAIACVLLSGVAEAQQKGPAEIIKSRQDLKKSLGSDFRIINEGLKADAPDTGAIAAAGKRMAEAIKAVNLLYPAGSGPEAGVKTRALPEIWSRNAEFKNAGNASEAEAAKFAATAAGGGVEAIKAGFKAMTDACVACHNTFRGPEEKK